MYSPLPSLFFGPGFFAGVPSFLNRGKVLAVLILAAVLGEPEGGLPTGRRVVVPILVLPVLTLVGGPVTNWAIAWFCSCILVVVAPCLGRGTNGECIPLILALVLVVPNIFWFYNKKY